MTVKKLKTKNTKSPNGQTIKALQNAANPSERMAVKKIRKENRKQKRARAGRTD